MLNNTAFVFIHNQRVSDEYDHAPEAVKAGISILKKPKRIYRVGLENVNEGMPRTYEGAVSRAASLLQQRPIGTVVTVRSYRPSNSLVDQVKFRRIKEADPTKDTRGPLGLDRVEGYIESEFPRARFAGDCVCKPDSDHNQCSAVDYFDTADNMVAMKNHLLANADFFDIKYVILFDRIYFADGSSQHYSGDFHSHIHVSVNARGENAC